MEAVALAKSSYIRVQIALASVLGITIGFLRWWFFNDLELSLWSSFIVFLEILIGGKFVWSVFQFYQPKRTLSFNPIFILISLVLIVGYGMYGIMHWNPLVSYQELYSFGLPFHLIPLLFVYWILYYEWWFLKNDIRTQQNTQRLLSLQEDLKNAEIRNIQQNVQPHFLFNSLNSINSLMLSDVDEAQKMIVQLSEFLRHSVLKNQKMYVSLGEEIAQVERYLSIEKIRFGHRLDYTLLCSPELRTLNIPSMVLQPLMENAIKHGLYGHLGETKITIRFFKVEDYLHIEMTNPFSETTLKSKGTGFGLASIRKKLYWLYAENHLLRTEAKDSLYTTTVKIPMKNESTIGG